MDLSHFHVMTMTSNPQRYESRTRLYNAFRENTERSGLNLWTAEVAFGNRPFAVTQSSDPFDLQLRTKSSELWVKERALTLLVREIQKKDPNWEIIAWVDSDIQFQKWHGPKAWFREAWHLHQHYSVLQLFSHAIDLGPKGEHLHTHNGFAYSYCKGLPFKSGYQNWHPGFAWSIRRDAYEATGGFVDFGILGSGDRHMACGWINQIEQSLNHKCSPGYWKKLIRWQELAEKHVRRNIGFLPGIVTHEFHGRKALRQYASRWKILVDTQFDPDHDIKEDSQGLWTLVDHGDVRSIIMRDSLRNYFLARNEDSIDLE